MKPRTVGCIGLCRDGAVVVLGRVVGRWHPAALQVGDGVHVQVNLVIDAPAAGLGDQLGNHTAGQMVHRLNSRDVMTATDYNRNLRSER